MSVKSFFIQLFSRNTEMPYYPDSSWQLVDADKGDFSLPNQTGAFIYLQAFFDPTTVSTDGVVGVAQLAVWSGARVGNVPDGAPIVSLVRFAYSGERVNFKGGTIVTSGVDVRGDTIQSTVIGAVNTNLTTVIAYGGMGGPK